MPSRASIQEEENQRSAETLFQAQPKENEQWLTSHQIFEVGDVLQDLLAVFKSF
jgi:hypothetical protein